MIEITLNGQKTQIKPNSNVFEFVIALELEPRSVALELNLEIIPKSEWENTIIKTGDKIEIVQFVGGGV